MLVSTCDLRVALNILAKQLDFPNKIHLSLKMDSSCGRDRSRSLPLISCSCELDPRCHECCKHSTVGTESIKSELHADPDCGAPLLPTHRPAGIILPSSLPI